MFLECVLFFRSLFIDIGSLITLLVISAAETTALPRGVLRFLETGAETRLDQEIYHSC